MSYSIAQLRATTDADLITAHDAAAANAGTGVGYYLDELRRRENAAAMRTSHRLAIASFVMTAVSTLTAIIAIIIAVAS